jgi:hypothetical protein
MVLSIVLAAVDQQQEAIVGDDCKGHQRYEPRNPSKGCKSVGQGQDSSAHNSGHNLAKACKHRARTRSNIFNSGFACDDGAHCDDYDIGHALRASWARPLAVRDIPLTETSKVFDMRDQPSLSLMKSRGITSQYA